MSERWIHVPNWDKYQHPDVGRSDKSPPPWIKLHTQLLDDDDFMELPELTQLVYLKILVTYAKTRRNLLGTTSALSRRFGQRVTELQLTSLNQAGLIHFVQAGCKQDASLDVEEIRKPPQPPLKVGPGKDSKEEAPLKARKSSRTPRELRHYTGCRQTFGTNGSGWVYDPLGTDKPPAWWDKPRPTTEEIMAALEAAA